MDLDIIDEQENPLLGRKTFTISIDHQGDATPESESLLNQFGAENDFELDHLSISSIDTSYGQGKSKTTITVHEEPVRDLSEDEPEEKPGEAEDEETSTEKQEPEEGGDEADPEDSEDLEEDDAESEGSDEVETDEEAKEGDD